MTTSPWEIGIIPEFTVGDRLRKARELTGLSQGDFAAEIDISPRTVGNYESDAVKPRRLALKAWALRTGVPLEWIETGVVNDESPSPDGERLSDSECAPRDLNPEPTDFGSIVIFPGALETECQPLAA